METICLQCGDRGFTNAFVYCVICLNFAVHRYCLDVIPKTLDEFVDWLCVDCELEAQKQSVLHKLDIHTRDHTAPQHIKSLETKKNDIVAIKTDDKGGPQESYDDACTKLDPVDFAESTSECSPMGFRGTNDRHAKLSVGISLLENMKKEISPPKKRIFMSSEANLEDPRRRRVLFEVREERTSAPHSTTDVCKDLLKDSNISVMVDCHKCAEPVITPVWRGSFDIWNKNDDILDGLLAHLSSKACQKVYEEARQFQPVLHLEMLRRSDLWPKSFEKSELDAKHIALYLFPSEISEQVFDHLVDEMMRQELSMKAILQNAELLIFTSTELPLLHWRFHGKYYLWGVFREKQHPHYILNHVEGSQGTNPYSSKSS